MAADAATPFVEFFPTAEYGRMRYNHVAGMALLASTLDIRHRVKRPQPVLIVPVRFLDARDVHSVAVVARSTAKFLRIMNLEELRFRVAGECRGKFVRLAPGTRHIGTRHHYRLANA